MQSVLMRVSVHESKMEKLLRTQNLVSAQSWREGVDHPKSALSLKQIAVVYIDKSERSSSLAASSIVSDNRIRTGLIAYQWRKCRLWQVIPLINPLFNIDCSSTNMWWCYKTSQRSGSIPLVAWESEKYWAARRGGNSTPSYSYYPPPTHNSNQWRHVAKSYTCVKAVDVVR